MHADAIQHAREQYGAYRDRAHQAEQQANWQHAITCWNKAAAFADVLGQADDVIQANAQAARCWQHITGGLAAPHH